MKPLPFKTIGALLLAVAALGFLGLAGQSDAQTAGPVKSLRGEVELPETAPTDSPKKQNTSRGQLERAYRQQPPLIPHRTNGYQISTKVNQCMNCHDWPNNVKEGAPKISETHYVDRSGIALDRVARTRWFCTQCHVTQANARELVTNTFKPATDVE